MNPQIEQRYWSENGYRWLLWFLRIVGTGTTTAFAAALMPEAWFVAVSEWLGFEFPDSPLGFYLARNLSAMYGFVGLGLLVLTTKLERYGPLIQWLGWAAIGFGSLQLVMDSWAGLPWWWTLLEGVSTIVGGGMILVLVSWCRLPKP